MKANNVSLFLSANADLFCEEKSFTKYYANLACSENFTVSILEELFCDLIWIDVELDSRYKPVCEDFTKCKWFMCSDEDGVTPSFDERYVELFTMLTGVVPILVDINSIDFD